MSSDVAQSKTANLPFALLVAVVVYLAWHSPSIHLVWTQGQLRGPDDFLRLHQVLNLLAGQSWFDTWAYRMSPPAGADIHWSRLVDLTIVILVSVFDIIVSQEAAWRIAVILWPLMVYTATFWLLVKLCKTLVPSSNTYLVLFFFALSVVTIAETAPGRIDHHNVQVLLLVTAILGLVRKPSWKSDLMIGLAMPVSLSIGMDSAALFLPLLVYLGLLGVFTPEASRQRLIRVGGIFAVSALVIYGITFAPENWSDDRCDAYSLFFVAALVKLGLALIAFGAALSFVPVLQHSRIARLITGVVLGGTALITLLLVFPHCAAGPFGNFTPELQTEWLSRVVEAKGILEAAKIEPSRWFSDFGFACITLIVCVAMVIRHARSSPELLPLFAVVLICTLGIFFQIRFLRTGIVAAIPFNVLLGILIWRWLKAFPFSLEPARIAALALICLPMTSLMWFTIGSIVTETRADNGRAAVGEVADQAQGETPLSCNAYDAYQKLRSLPVGTVMSDINSATPILVHTNHSVVSGPYHRNADAILDVMRFFETDAIRAKEIADRLNIDYVSLCTEASAGVNTQKEASISAMIKRNELPVWLEQVSASDDTIQIFKLTE